MSGPHWIAFALAATVLIGSMRLAWQHWRGRSDTRDPDTRRAGLRLAALLTLQLAAGVLLYLTLLPPSRDTATGALTVLTAGADPQLWQPQPGDTVIALPEAPATAGAEYAPDLATALRQHPSASALRLVGDGLASRDRDAVLPAQVTFVPAAAPTGWAALVPPATSVPGATFAVHGRAQGVESPEAAHAELIDPAGAVVDRAGLADDGRVTLHGTARAAGRSGFRLRLLDAAQEVIDTVVVPLQTLDQPAPRVLIVAGAPGPELKYLRRWAVDTGLPVQAQASAGGGVSLGDKPVALTAARLAETDVLILDERSLATLGAGQRAAIRQALRDGLGVLVRSTGPMGNSARRTLRDWGLPVSGDNRRTPLRLPAEADAALLQARRGPPRPAVHGTSSIREAATASHTATPPTLEQFALRPDQAHALLYDERDRPVGGWRDIGRGRLALLPVTDSYQLVLVGRDDLHAELWSGVLATLARALPQPAAVRVTTAMPWVGERVVLCGLPDAAEVRASDSDDTPVTLQIDPATGADRCAGYWPQRAGWHELRHGDTEQAFHVSDPADAPALHRQQTLEATWLRIGNRGVIAAAATAPSTPVPGPRWPWLLMFVLAAGLLWWVERWRPRTVETH
ncbi:hypothetical protein N792_11580 [Lysobacter concretionis Ko07 = DSM 16239]|uniref:Carboxypeptidase regulatory-like domain-containing protein n=1 Tax=Lysobacter concretionis Ko07 = DSM 16239 TaxID=1122185 RepID=A0A0A0EK91_9GAMM|nr:MULTISPECIES: hypothetical protein [Lysobacter]KGM51371.1 hypothetical protein N792_11580 [Lysobacter concretionis Ko07 = DSM 16239]QOD91076.1 hypothetical protein H2514_13115 [Lysobacter sp. CW239]